MRVEETMKAMPTTCSPRDSLAEAGEIMRSLGCGVLPVVDDEGSLSGILTDRDICCSLARVDRKASDIAVGFAMTEDVQTCTKSDPVHSALETMKLNRVRRLPVIDDQRHVEGLLSLDDIAAAAHQTVGETDNVTWRQVGAALQAITEHSLPARIN